MAGLLNYDQPDPLTLGLLGFSQAISTPRSRGGGVAAALGAFPAGQMQAAEMQRRIETDELRKQMMQAQMQNNQSEAEQRKTIAEARRAALEQAQKQTEAQRRVLLQFSGPPAGFRDASIAQTGNAPAGYTPPQQRSPQVTPQMVAEFAAAGGDPALLRAIAESRNFGRDEVAARVERRGADGTPEMIRESKYGDIIGQAVPKPFEMRMQDIGGSVVPVNPYAPTALTKTMTPGDIASNQVALGNLGVAQANLGLSRERLAMDKLGGADGGFQYIQTPTGLVAVPKRPGADGAIVSRPVVDPVSGMPVGGAQNAGAQTRVVEANDAIALIDQAEKLIDKSTGSYLGAGADMVAQGFGVSTRGAQAAAQLKALEGALVSKMPKMSGPQSDKDVLLYKQMAGQVGDSTIPAATKKAALQTIREIQERYAGMPAGGSLPKPPAEPRVPEQAFAAMPPAQQSRGKTVRDTLTGKTYKSNGMSWVEQ